jgi:hypothetical protein
MTHKVNGFRGAVQTASGTVLCLLAMLPIVLAPKVLKGQTGGEGAIAGTVTDNTGAAIPNATITATNVATNISATRTSSGTGTYSISPLLPGTYSVQVTAKGFKTLKQENLDVVALGSLGFNPVLTIGEATETVTVTSAPPVLNTTDATVGLVMENATYSALPLQMNNAQRDPTAFAALAPGAQAGTRLPIIGGTSNYLGQLYLDGMPAETINQQGDNRLVSQAVSVDSVDQFQVVTSTPPAEFMGAGAANFTMKSGGTKYHGQASDFVRNTVFDAWGFTSKLPQINSLGQSVPATKPTEHQNELSLSVGGKVPHTGEKLFFFVAYDKFHSRRGANPSAVTIPTMLERSGDFTELNGGVGSGGLTGIGATNPALIYDPTTNSCVGTACTRQPFMGVKNGVPTNNVIPSSYLSPITQKMESLLPPPSNPSLLTNNYVGGFPSGFDNHVIDYRVDYDISSRQRLSAVGAIGAVHYLQNYQNVMPLPYTQGTIAQIFPKVFDIEDAFTINSRMTNQLKYGFTRFPQPQVNATDGKTQYSPATMGITNVPSGQASTLFPGATFGTTGATGKTLDASGKAIVGTAETVWNGSSGGASSTQNVVPSTYAVVDNFQWVKGKHSMIFGFSYEWEEVNSAIPVGYTGGLSLTYNSNSTANYTNNSSTLSSSSGLSYASYLLGAVGGQPSVGLNPVNETGGRYHVASPYAEDSWKVNPKLTLDIGLRWDYFPPFHEVKDRWSFLNPNLTNPLTGTPGEMQFAGNYGGSGVSCGCKTPVQSYWKNFGPRLGLNYAIDDKTVFRAGGALVFSQAGGVGGRGGNAGGTGQLGFNISANGNPEGTTGVGAAPSFYLNNGTTWTTTGMANTDMLGKGFVYPTPPPPSAASQQLNTGNYLLSTTGTAVGNAGGVSFADFYFSGRAPEFIFWNAGVERSITKDMTIAINYVGDQSHFLSTGGNVRGYWNDQLDPVYLAALGNVTDSTGSKPILISAATAANVAKAQSVMTGLTLPAYFVAAASANPTSSTLTMAKGLTAFPQYSGVTDLWGSNVANFTYHSLQITLLQRLAHGLTFNINYTYSKNIGDDGTFRSGFNIPAAAISGGGQSWHQDRIDRSWTTTSVPDNLHAFGVWNLPFGKDHLGGNTWAGRNLAGGWQLSGIYTYNSGSPMAVTSNLCTGTNFPNQGQCMPDVAPGASSARINGSFGTGPNGTSTCNLGLVAGCQPIAYVDSTKFKAPSTNGTIYLIGNTPRTQALNLRNPGTQNLDAALHRSFALPKDIGTIVFEVDCINVWNKVTMNGPAVNFGANGFGTIGGASGNARDFQFAGHFNF